MELLLALFLTTAYLADVDPRGEEVLGLVGRRVVEPGETLIEMAREHNIGFNAIAAANPGLDPFVPPPGATLTIPTSWIVPRAAKPGTVVVNVSEMRLYLVPEEGSAPVTFPVGVGMDEWKTPLGTYTVVSKTENPVWYPPRSIRREDPTLPAKVPPGPDNPLGTHALRLSSGSILIHGTDEPYGVGRKASHGCIRLYPEDIPDLFGMVPVKARVTMVREPVKVGVRAGRVLVEIHDDPDARVDLRAEAAQLLAKRGLRARVDARKLEEALEERRGLPVDVSLDAL